MCAGASPIGKPLIPSYADSMLVVGDSAGHVKSTTGGGIYFGLKSAEIAAETAIGSLENNNTSSEYLRRYELRWKKNIGRELRLTSIVREILDRLSDNEIDTVFQIMADDKIRRIIETHGDTAYQSKILRPVLSEFLKKSIDKPTKLILLTKILCGGLAGLLT